MTEQAYSSQRIGYLDALIPSRSIRYSCNGNFTGCCLDSAHRTTELAISVMNSIEIHRITLTGGTPTGMDIVDTIQLSQNVCSMATVPIRLSSQSENDVRHIQDGIIFTLEDCTIGFLLYDQMYNVFLYFRQGPLPLMTRSKNTAHTACGHKIMVEASRPWVRVWVYTNENYISKLDFDYEVSESNSSGSWMSAWLENLENARINHANLNELFKIRLSLYYPFGGLKDINISSDGEDSSFIFIVDMAPGTQALVECPVAMTAKDIDYETKVAGATRRIVRNMGITKVQKCSRGCIAIGNNGFILMPSFTTVLFNKIKADTFNEILLLIDWKVNDACIAIVSQTSRSRFSANKQYDRKKTDAVAIIINRLEPLHPIYVDIELQNMTPISSSFLSPSVLFIAGCNKSVIFQIHEQPGYKFEPLLEFTGIGPITDIKRIKKQGFKQQSFAVPQLVLACTVAGSAFGGNLAIVGASIIPDAVKGYQDEQQNFPMDLFEILHMGTQYIIASYLGNRLRVLKVDRRNTPQRSLRAATSGSLSERSEILEEIKNLDRLPFKFNDSANRLILATSISYDCCLFAYSDEIVTFRKNQRTLIYSAPSNDKVSEVKSSGAALLVRLFSGSTFWMKLYLFEDSLDCVISKLETNDVEAIGMVTEKESFAVLVSGDSILTVAFVEDNQRLRGHLKNNRKDIIDSIFIKSNQSEEKAVCYVSYATGTVEVWGVHYTKRELFYMYTICVGDSPTKLMDHESMILAVNEGISLSEDGRYFRPLALPGVVEDSNQRYTALNLISGEIVLATDKNIMLISISSAFSSTYHKQFSIPGANYCTPFRLCQLHNGHLVTLNRHNPVAADEESYSFTIWNQDLQVLKSKPVPEFIVPFTLTELSNLDGFLIGGEKDAYEDIVEVEKKYWTSYNEINGKEDSHVSKPSSINIARASGWSEGQLGHVMAFEADDIGDYQPIISMRTAQGPVLSAKDIEGKVLLAVGGGYSIESLDALIDQNHDVFRVDWSSQTPSLCIAADVSPPYVALADMMSGVVVSLAKRAKLAKKVQYWKYPAVKMATDIKFLPRNKHEAPDVESRLIVTNENGVVSLLQLLSEQTVEQESDKELESNQDHPKVIKLAGQVELNEQINKICLNDGAVWNPCTYRAYEQFFEPRAVLAGSEGGLYQFGWLVRDRLDSLSTEWFESENGENRPVDCIDTLLRLQSNLRVVWELHTNMKWSVKYGMYNDLLSQDVSQPRFSGDKQFINGVLLRKYWDLSYEQQNIALGNGSIGELWLLPCGNRQIVEELLRKLDSIAR